VPYNAVRRHFALSSPGPPSGWQICPFRKRPPEGARRAVRRACINDCAVVEEKALEMTGLARMRPCDLRHSAATLLLAAGEHPKIDAELLGHAKVTLTLDTYSHVVPGLLD